MKVKLNITIQYNTISLEEREGSYYGEEEEYRQPAMQNFDLDKELCTVVERATHTRVYAGSSPTGANHRKKLISA